MKLHVAETFHSLKGEGLWSGVPMFFIRFAGCNVGKIGPADMEVRRSDEPALTIMGTTCTSWDGRKFGCDTDYTKYEELDLLDDSAVAKFFQPVWEKRVVLTGGEPIAQLSAFQRMLELCSLYEKIPHIETSGTRDFHFVQGQAWVALAPKFGCSSLMINQADEIKLLVDEDFDLSKVPQEVLDHDLVFFCPINDGFNNDWQNIERCKALCKQVPNSRVGVQLHKLLGIR